MTKQKSTYRGLRFVPRLYPIERIVVGAVCEPVQPSEHPHLTEAPPAVAGQAGLGRGAALQQGVQRIF